MDYSNIIEVREVISPNAVNALLSEGWVILGLAPGQSESHMPYITYSLGRPCPEAEVPKNYL